MATGLRRDPAKNPGEGRVTVDFPTDANWRYGSSARRRTINCEGLDSLDLTKLLPKGKITVQGIPVFDYVTDTWVTLEQCAILSYTAPWYPLGSSPFLTTASYALIAHPRYSS